MMPELPIWVALPAALLLIVGGLAALIGAIGLLRFPDFFSRMHPPTMCATLGTACALIASMLVSSALVGRPVLHEVLIAVFLVITTPITAILLMRAAIYRGGARNVAPEAAKPGAEAAPALTEDRSRSDG
jgi:multicomponent K+:H+ antiporter subunit G